MFIDKSYFILGLLIPQLDDVNTGPAETIGRYIDRYEPDFMTKALGYTFWQLLKDHATDARFIALISGGDYAIPQHKVAGHWNGFTNTFKQSPVANYVYWMYWRDKAQSVGGDTIIRAKTENATVVSPIDKMVTAWNDMIDMLDDMYRYLYANKDVYPEFDICLTYRFEPQNILNL